MKPGGKNKMLVSTYYLFKRNLFYKLTTGFLTWGIMLSASSEAQSLPSTASYSVAAPAGPKSDGVTVSMPTVSGRAKAKFIPEPPNTLQELDNLIAKLKVEAAPVPKELREILEAVLLAEDDVNAGNYASARTRIDALLAKYPYDNKVWDKLRYWELKINKSMPLGDPPGYCQLRMLDLITRVALKPSKIPSTTYNVTVALMRYARYATPPEKGGAPITVEINQRSKADNYFAYRQTLNLFCQYIWAITDGELKVNVQFHEVQSTIAYTYDSKSKALSWSNYPELVSKLPQQVQDITDMYFAFIPKDPTDKKIAGIKINAPGGQGTINTSPYNRAILFGSEASYSYATYMTQRLWGPRWVQHEFFHHLYGNLFPEYGLEKTSHAWFSNTNWPPDFVLGNEVDYYAESFEKRLHGSNPSLAARLKGAPNRPENKGSSKNKKSNNS